MIKEIALYIFLVAFAVAWFSFKYYERKYQSINDEEE